MALFGENLCNSKVQNTNKQNPSGPRNHTVAFPGTWIETEIGLLVKTVLGPRATGPMAAWQRASALRI